MALALTILLWLLLVLLVLLAGVLLTPVRLRGHIRTAPQLSYRVEVRVLGGLTPAFALVDSTRQHKPAADKAAAQKKPRSKKPKKKMARRGFKNGARMAAAFPRLFSDLFRTIHLDFLSVDGEIGLDDPADTGRLYGWLTPLQFAVVPPANIDVSLRPNFEHPGLAGEAEAAVHLTAAALVPPAVRFAWHAFGPRR